MKLSVCMIVRDEGLTIRRILNIVSQFADEIIIVDTGSKDRTKDIVHEYTDKVYDFEWVQDFSRARNYSFSKATCDYVMWLDADDYITPKNIKKIKQLKQNLNFDCCMCKYILPYSTFAHLEYYRERIVRRVSQFKWKGFVHEAITPCGKIVYSDIEIEHRKIKCGDPKRNLKIYRYHKKLGESFDARSAYYYAKELYYTGFYVSCIRALNKFLRYKDNFVPNVQDAILCKARCFDMINQNKKSISVLLNYAKDEVLSAEMCCVLGDSFVKLKKYNQAIHWYIIALSSRDDIQSGAFCDGQYMGVYPCLQLCCLYYTLGDRIKSEYYHKKSKRFCPNHPAVKFNEQFFKNLNKK